MSERPKDCGCMQGFCWVQHLRDTVGRMRAARVVSAEAHSPTAEEVGCHHLASSGPEQEVPPAEVPYNKYGE